MLPEQNVNVVELARWQGGMDERVSESARRLDVINGDIKEIKIMVGEMREENRQYALATYDRRRKDRIALIAAVMPLFAGLVTAITLLVNNA